MPAWGSEWVEGVRHTFDGEQRGGTIGAPDRCMPGSARTCCACLRSGLSMDNCDIASMLEVAVAMWVLHLLAVGEVSCCCRRPSQVPHRLILGSSFLAPVVIWCREAGKRLGEEIPFIPGTQLPPPGKEGEVESPAPDPAAEAPVEEPPALAAELAVGEAEEAAAPATVAKGASADKVGVVTGGLGWALYREDSEAVGEEAELLGGGGASIATCPCDDVAAHMNLGSHPAVAQLSDCHACPATLPRPWLAVGD